MWQTGEHKVIYHGDSDLYPSPDVDQDCYETGILEVILRFDYNLKTH